MNVVSYLLDTLKNIPRLTPVFPPGPYLRLISWPTRCYLRMSKSGDWHLRGTFSVFRSIVLEALRWLIGHNPYYCNIIISDIRLEGLPEDDIPPEIIIGDDVNPTLERFTRREHDGYVPCNEDGDAIEEDNYDIKADEIFDPDNTSEYALSLHCAEDRSRTASLDIDDSVALDNMGTLPLYPGPIKSEHIADIQDKILNGPDDSQ